MAARALPKPARLIAIGIKRVSLLKQVGNYSFDGQSNKFALLEQKWNCSIPPELMIEDKGYSGTDFNRPAIKQAKSMIRAGVANAVAFPWLDRFAREMEGGLATIREFRELNAEILLGDLGWYQDSGWYKAQMHMFMTIAQYQKDDIADKSRWGVQAKLERGLAHYGAPYGWHMVTALEIAARALNAGQQVPLGKPQNFYERVVDDLEVVRLIGELALAGGRDGSQRGICRELDARGIPTPTASRGIERKGQTGWNPIAVRNIVGDEVYSSGIWHYGKRQYFAPDPKRIRKPDVERHRVRSVGKFRPREEWAGSMPMPGGPIWTPDEQAAIQEALKRNGELSTGKLARPYSEGGREAVLKSLCVCGATLIDGGGECGAAIAPWRGSRIKLDGTRSMWYRCINRHQSLGHHLCDGESIKAELLEDAVWERTKLALCDELEDLIAARYGEITREEDERVLAGLREEFQRKTQWLREAMRKEIEARAAADKAMYAGLVIEYKADLALLDRRIRTASACEQEQIDIGTIQRDARAAFVTTDPARRRAILCDWIPLGGIRYAHGSAEITLSIPMAVNCESAEHAICNKQPFYLTVNTRVAA